MIVKKLNFDWIRTAFMSFRLTSANKHTLLYGVSLAVLLIVLRWLEYQFIFSDYSQDLYIGAIAVLFTSLGIWLALKLAKPRKETIIIEREVIVNVPAEPIPPASQLTEPFTPDQAISDKYGISNRELEVLQLMASGLSNQEIAASLFVSLNTVKTHTSRLFEKLDVNRRTQAVDKGRKLGLIS